MSPKIERVEWSKRSEFRSVQGIYVIINTVTRDRYVGKAINVCSRLEQHVYKIRTNCRIEMPKMCEDFEKHGFKSFRFGLAERVPEAGRLDERETWWWNFFQPYYNMQNCNFSRHNWDSLGLDAQTLLLPLMNQPDSGMLAL